MSSTQHTRERLGPLFGFIGVVVFGDTLPATRIAGLCSLALLIALRRPLPPKRLWPQLAVVMVCVSFGFPLPTSLALLTVDASQGGVVLGILPIATALLAVVITHERPSPRWRALRWSSPLPCASTAAHSRSATYCCSALRPGGSPRKCRDRN